VNVCFARWSSGVLMKSPQNAKPEKNLRPSAARAKLRASRRNARAWYRIRGKRNCWTNKRGSGSERAATLSTHLIDHAAPVEPHFRTRRPAKTWSRTGCLPPMGHSPPCCDFTGQRRRHWKASGQHHRCNGRSRNDALAYVRYWRKADIPLCRIWCRFRG